jgi:hypothetical protein
MPSGFQNSQDQLTPNFYRVVVTMSGGTATFSSTATDNDSGAVEVDDFNAFTTLNTSYNNSKRRARGNIRWHAIIEELSRFNQPMLLDVTATKAGPSALTAADDVSTALAFTVGYAQEEYVLGGWQKVIGAGTFSDGATSLTTTAFEGLSDANLKTAMQNCIKEAVVRGITRGGASGYTRTYRTMDPTGNDASFQDSITVTQPDTPADIWADVSVTRDDDFTQSAT